MSPPMNSKIYVDFFWLLMKVIRRKNKKLGFTGDRNPIDSTVISFFFSDLFQLCKRFSTKDVTLFFDSFPTFREELLSEYKGNRQVKFEKFKSLDPYIDIADALGFKMIKAASYEADDLFYHYISSDFSRNTIIIFANDNDIYQCLLRNNIIMLQSHRGSIYTQESFYRDFGFSPVNYGLYKALVGDKSDNIKGVPYFKKKIAREIAYTSPDPEYLFKNLKDMIISDAAKARLESHKDVIERNFKLCKLSMCKDVEVVTGIFNKFEFFKFCKKYNVVELVSKYPEDVFDKLPATRMVF